MGILRTRDTSTNGQDSEIKQVLDSCQANFPGDPPHLQLISTKIHEDKMDF